MQNSIGRFPPIVVSINIDAFNEAIWQFDEIATVVEETKAHESSNVSDSAALEPEMLQAFSLNHTVTSYWFQEMSPLPLANKGWNHLQHHSQKHAG